jgi:hypothetical protein
MPDSGTLSNVACANNELKIDNSDESDEKTIWVCDGSSPLNELLPLWRFPVEHIEVNMKEPAPKSWPDPTLSLKRLNLDLDHHRLHPCEVTAPLAESVHYDYRCHVDDEKRWQLCSDLTAALQQVKTTLRELDLSLGLFSDFAEEVEALQISPVKGQLGSLGKLRAPIVTLLGWLPDE